MGVVGGKRGRLRKEISAGKVAKRHEKREEGQVGGGEKNGESGRNERVEARSREPTMREHLGEVRATKDDVACACIIVQLCRYLGLRVWAMKRMQDQPGPFWA